VRLLCLRSGRRWSRLDCEYGDSYVGVMLGGDGVRIDRADSTAVFEQVAAEIRRAILDGEARPGERLPQRGSGGRARCEHEHGVALVALLRDEGLLEFRRGRGVTVAGTPERTVVLEQARALIEVARRHGYAAMSCWR